MRLLISGGSGFIGRPLCHSLVEDGHQLVILSRRPRRHAAALPAQCEWIDSATALRGEVDGIINLAGANIGERRWSARRKQILFASRLETTHDLIDACHRLTTPPRFLISGSAIGYYGHHAEGLLHEDDTPRAGFSHELCHEWEKCALEAERLGTRVCLIRTGIVLGPGGVLARLLPAYRLGLGGRLGSGRQWMSWIHRDDEIDAIRFLIGHPSLRGPFNLTAPHPVTNAEFNRELGRILHRPTLLPLPAGLLRVVFGEMAELFLNSARVLPTRLQEAGFHFRYSHLVDALHALLK